MSGRALLILFLAVLALGALAFFAWDRPPTAIEDPLSSARDPATTHASDPALLTQDASSAPRTEKADPPERTSRAPGREAGSADVPMRTDLPVSPRGPAPGPVRSSGRRAPREVTMSSVQWQRVSGLSAVQEIVDVTGLDLEASDRVRKILQKAEVSLELEGRRASHVLQLILVPYSLDYEVQGDRLVIVEDDE